MIKTSPADSQTCVEWETSYEVGNNYMSSPEIFASYRSEGVDSFGKAAMVTTTEKIEVNLKNIIEK